VFVCLFPFPIGTYSQPKIETKERIEKQINRDGYVFIWRTASNRAGKEMTVCKDEHLKRYVYKGWIKWGVGNFLCSHHKRSVQTLKFRSEGNYLSLGVELFINRTTRLPMELEITGKLPTISFIGFMVPFRFLSMGILSHRNFVAFLSLQDHLSNFLASVSFWYRASQGQMDWFKPNSKKNFYTMC
jgi:hypothetical protein